MRFNSDSIDNLCRELYNHSDWAYFDTLTQDEQKKALLTEVVIVLYKKPRKSYLETLQTLKGGD